MIVHDAIESILRDIGEDPSREGLVRTPERVARSMRHLTRGYGQDPREVVGDAIFTETYDEMVIVKDIELYSLCEHHMLPFWGRAHIAYIPNGKVLGLSKLPRLLDVFACRLQVQERLSTQVAEVLEEVLAPRGVGVVVEAKHLCMMMRGVQQQNSFAVTSSLRGEFESDSKTRAEFLELIRQKASPFT